MKQADRVERRPGLIVRGNPFAGSKIQLWREDLFCIALAILAIAAPCMVVGTSTVASMVPGSEGDIPLLLSVLTSLLLYALCALLAALLLIAAAVRRRWRACLYGLFALTFPTLAFLPARSSGDLIHLAWDYPAYKRVIDGAPEQTVFRFPWGDHARFVLDGLQDETLVYDRNSALAANLNKAREAENGLHIYTRHLWGKFFIETES